MARKLTEIIRDLGLAVADVASVADYTGGLSQVDSVVITDQGDDFDETEVFAFTGGSPGTPATADATIVGGKVTLITITNPGDAYTGTPTFGWTGGAGSGATFAVQMAAQTLDAILTANKQIGAIIRVVINGDLHHYQLLSGTETTSIPSRVRGADYATTTNERYWQLVGSVTALNGSVIGPYAKADTQAVDYPFAVRSDDATAPLQLRFGIKTDATGASRYVAIDSEDGGAARDLLIQPSGGSVGFGALDSIRKYNFYADGRVMRIGTGSGTAAATLDFQGDRAIFGLDDSTGTLSGTASAAFIKAGGGRGISLNVGASTGAKVTIDTSVNVGIRTAVFGAGAAGVLAILNGTQGAALANAVQIVSKDLSAGNTMLSVRTEGGGAYSAGTPPAANATWAMEIDGTTRYFLLADTPAS